MGRHASAYERELKGLLEGDPEAWGRYGRGLRPAERYAARAARRARFLVVRAAGSFGFDLVALRREFAFPLEVKASRAGTIHFSAASGRAAAQLAAHRKAVAEVGLAVLYAYRRVGLRNDECWRIFIVPTAGLDGHLGVLRRRLPPIDRTRDGNAVLRWMDGMPLAEFLEMVHFLTDRGSEPAA